MDGGDLNDISLIIWLCSDDIDEYEIYEALCNARAKPEFQSPTPAELIHRE